MFRFFLGVAVGVCAMYWYVNTHEVNAAAKARLNQVRNATADAIKTN